MCVHIFFIHASLNPCIEVSPISAIINPTVMNMGHMYVSSVLSHLFIRSVKMVKGVNKVTFASEVKKLSFRLQIA